MLMMRDMLASSSFSTAATRFVVVDGAAADEDEIAAIQKVQVLKKDSKMSEWMNKNGLGDVMRLRQTVLGSDVQ